MDFYEIDICGLKRKLPYIQIGKNTKIASFNILGDVELVSALAQKISQDLKAVDFDYLVGPEVKVVPLIQEVARLLRHKKFIICRKSIKPYMRSPIKITPLSHFPKHVKPLVIDGFDAKLIENKKVIIIDDVISTGVTMRMLNKLMEQVNARVMGYYVAIKQGKQFDTFDGLQYLAELPIFKTGD